MLVRDQIAKKKDVDCLHIKVMVWISCKLNGRVCRFSTSALKGLERHYRNVSAATVSGPEYRFNC